MTMAGEQTKSASSLADRMKAGMDAAMHSMEDAAKKTKEGMQDFSKMTKEGMHDLSKRTKDSMHDFSVGMHDTSDTISKGINETALRTQVGFKKAAKATNEQLASLGSGSWKDHKKTSDEVIPKETTPLVAANEGNRGKRQVQIEGREVTFANQPQESRDSSQQQSSKLLKTLHWIKKKHEAIMAALIAVAVCQLWSDYQLFLDTQLPIHIAVVWILIAMMGGGFLGRLQAKDEIEQAIAATQRAAAATVAAKNDMRVSVQSEITMEDLEKQGFGSGIRSLLADIRVPKTPWTTLKKTNSTSSVQEGRRRLGTGLVSMSMTGALFGVVPKEQKKSLKDLGVSHAELQAALEEDKSLTTTTMGNTVDDPERLRAKSLEQDYVKPLCQTRGLDIFMGDCAEADLAEHSFLIEHGLRDCPTFILNLMTQWGNVIMYFELPSWVQDWDNLPQESPDDPEDVVALKRFLEGDDEYRKWRLKCLPVLVDGPGPIRFVAPPKKTVTIIRPSLPATWKKYPAKLDVQGNVLQHCCLEMDGDLMSERGMRTGAALIKRYLGSIVGDCALLIEKPYLQEEEEPRACLGLCRFDRIDITGCPDMPPRMDQGKTQEERDMLRASVLAGKPLQ